MPMLPKRIKRESSKPDAGHRSPAHRSWVRSHGCCVPGCDNRPIECAHVRRGTDGGTSLKPSDRWCISLCNSHHSLQHAVGEITFERTFNLDMREMAEEFFRKSPHRNAFRE